MANVRGEGAVTSRQVNVRVQRVDGSMVTLSLSSAGWHIVTEGERNVLVSGGEAHAFTTDGYYDASRPAPLFLEQDVKL